MKALRYSLEGFHKNLHSGYFCGVWPFWAVAHFELDLIACFQLIKLHILQFFGMKEEVLFHSLAGDETESAIHYQSNFALFHSIGLINNTHNKMKVDYSD